MPNQRPIAALPADGWDVAVVGAGPAGATAAAHLAQRGHRVLLLDRRLFPRDKVCGDGLIPDAIGALERLGVLDEVKRIGHTAHVLSGYSPSGVRVDINGTFITLKRVMLDALLVRRAAAAGATLAQGVVDSLDTTHDDRVELHVQGHDWPIVARVALLATGANVDLATKLGRVNAPAPSGIALRCYVHSTERIDRLVLSYDRVFLPGYAWIFPLGNGEYNVGCGTFFRGAEHVEVNLRDTFTAFMKRFPLAQRLLANSSGMTPLKGAMLRCGLAGAAPFAGPRLLAIGETIGTTFPFTGEGIGKAMETAELAADIVNRALSTGDFSRLTELPDRITRELASKYIGYRVAESWLSRAWLTDLLARRAARSVAMRRAVEGLLNETIDPRAVFSLRGLLRSLVR